jgi:hypothetical protein
VRDEDQNEPGVHPENEAVPAESSTDSGPSHSAQPATETAKTGALLRASDARPSAITGCRPIEKLLGPIADEFELYLDQHGVAQLEQKGIPIAYRVGANQATQLLRMAFLEHGETPSDYELTSINNALIARAQAAGILRPVWLRVAPFGDGVELDVGDDRNTRIRVTPGKVEVINSGSPTTFRRPPSMRALPMPANHGDWKLLRPYVNLEPVPSILLVAYIAFTLVSPKVDGVTFLILLLLVNQGSGKSSLTRTIQRFTDPTALGLQAFPKSERDLAIAVQQGHVVAFDNLRAFTPAMADALCRVSTGGAFATRRLYTDDEQMVHRLHCGLILNGLHTFIDQPDLAQRCLPLVLKPLDETDRREETEMMAALNRDTPIIFRGLLDLAAEIMARLPEAEVVAPERVISFSKWLAAMELVYGAPAGVYQQAYRNALSGGMLDALLEDPLASVVLTFAANLTTGQWSGTPRALYQELCDTASHRTVYSRDWPRNEIAMGKQLRSLQAGLQRQGVDVLFSRGRERSITIVRMEDPGHE